MRFKSISTFCITWIVVLHVCYGDLGQHVLPQDIAELENPQHVPDNNDTVQNKFILDNAMSPPDNSLLDVSNSSEIVEGGSAEKPSNREKVETSTCATEESVSNKNAGSKSKNKVVKDPLESYLLQLQSSHPEQNDVQKAKKPEREIILNNPEGEHTEYFETEEKSSHKAQNSDKNHATKENTNPIVGDVPIEVLEENTSKSPGDALLGNENQYQLDKIPGEPSYRMSDALLGLDSPSVTAQKPSNNTENDKSLKNQETTGSKLKNNGSLGYGNNVSKDQTGVPNTANNAYGTSQKPIQSTDNKEHKNEVYDPNNPLIENPGAIENNKNSYYGDSLRVPKNDVYGLNNLIKELPAVSPNTVDNSHGNPQQPIAPNELNNPGKGKSGLPPNTVDNSYGKPQQPLAPKETKLADNKEHTNDVNGLNNPIKEQGISPNTVDNSYGDSLRVPKNDVHVLNNPPKEQGVSPNTVDTSYGNPQQPLAPKGTKLANNNEPTNDVYGLNKPNKEQQGVPLNTVGNSYGNPQQPLAPKETKLADNKEHTNDVYGLNNPPKEQGVSPNTVDNSYGNSQEPLAPKGTKLANNNEHTNDVYGLNKPNKEQQGVPLNTVGNSYGNPQQPLAPKETKLADNKEHTNDVNGLNNPIKEQGISPNTVDNSYGDSLRVPKNDVHVLNNPTKEQEVSPNTVDNSHGNPQQPLAPKGTNVVTNKEPSNDLYGLNNPTKGQPGTSNTVDNSYGNQQQLLKENSLKGTKSADNSDGNSLPRKSPNDKESQNDVHGLNNFPKSQLGELARTVNDSYGNPQQISPKGIKLPENTEPKTNVYGLNNNSKDKPSGLPNSNDNSSGDFLREKSPKDKSQVGDLPNTVDNSHGFKDFSLSSGDQKGDKKGTQLNPESARSPDGLHVKTQYVQENSVDTLGKGKLPKGPTSNESLEVKEPLLDFKEPTVKLGTSNNGNKSSNATNNDSINKYENFGNPKQQVGSKITKNGNSSSGLPSDMSGKPLIAIDYAATEPGTEGSKGWPEYGSNSIDGTSETTLEHFDNEEPPGPEVVPVGLALKQREMLKLCSLPKLPKGENICYQRKATNGTKIETWVKICDVIAKTLGFYQGLCLYIESPIDSEVYYSVCGISKADTLNTSDSSSWAFLTTQDVPIKLPKDQECHNGYKVLHEVQSSAKTNRK